MERNREITVKGIGNLKVPVDYVEVHLTLEELDKDYENGYENFTKKLMKLQKCILPIGFEMSDLKTRELLVAPKYDSVRKNDGYTEVFKGYNFATEMKLSFDFDSKKLGKVISEISATKVNPIIKVEFTVKDKETVKNNLLAAAAKDAKAKASILCDAMDVKLGQLLTINYNWDEVTIYSGARYEMARYNLYECSDEMTCADFTPDDISVNDDASFVWAIDG